MKELITGQSGFIGDHLAEHLLKQGHEVKRISLRNDTFQNEVLDYKPDHIFHLAAYGSHSGENDIPEMMQVNITKSFVLMHTALVSGCKAVVLCGSSSEYGTTQLPMTEDSLPRPDSFYAASKVAVTMLARAFAKERELATVVARPFSVFGPGERDTRFIPTLIKSCLTGDPMKLCPEQNHDWIYINDFVEGLLTCAQHADSLRGEAVNFGSGMQVTNQVVVETVQTLMGKEANITERLLPKKQDSKTWIADTSKAMSFGWEPKTGFVKGLQKTIEYYESKHRTT